VELAVIPKVPSSPHGAVTFVFLLAQQPKSIPGHPVCQIPLRIFHPNPAMGQDKEDKVTHVSVK
jgi:hypothetical protein